MSVLLCVAEARAGAGTAFGESSRAAGLADAVSARPGDAGTILLNPAGLADVDEPLLELSGHVDSLSASFARTGEADEDRGRVFGGFGLAAATPLPGPAWLRAFRVGLALDFPAAHALRVDVPERADEPTSPIYDGRPDRMTALGAIAWRPFERLRLGAGLSLTPSLDAPTDVTYVAGRDPSVTRSVEVRLDRRLDMGAAPFAGVRFLPMDALAFALVYRTAQISTATGSQRTLAGGILANDPIDYFEFWDPAELVFGVAVAPSDRLSLSTDVTWHRWSDFKSGFDRAIDPPFHDTVSVRAGVEWKQNRWLAFRGGGAFEPTPVPEQTGATNYLDANAFVLALGGGVDLRELAGAPLRIDAHVRARLGGTQHATKSIDQMPDSDPTTPGKQIDDLGYPGFTSHATLVQAGISVTLFVGKERPR